MARKHDTLFRDRRLPLVHSGWGFPFPVAGMSFPMVEYDRGRPVGVVSYLRRDKPLPAGPEIREAYRAFGRLRGEDGAELPFITAQYDPRNWSFRVFPHNKAAADLTGSDGWLACTEEHFVRLLYRMRGRKTPRLSSYGIELSQAPWQPVGALFPDEDWDGQALSVRRRGYEPEGVGVTFGMRAACADIDLAVIGESSGDVALLVDYKLDGAYVDPRHKTFQALSGIRTGGAGHTLPVPAMITQYDPSGESGWKFHVWCLNEPAERMLTFVMQVAGAVAAPWRPSGWTYLTESLWQDVLEEASRQ